MSLKQTAIKYFSTHIKVLNSMAGLPEADKYYNTLIRIYSAALDALITVEKQEEDIKSFQAIENQKLFIKSLTLEAVLFDMVRQRIIYLGGARGKTPEELNVEAYRQMQDMLDNEDFSDASRELAIAKKIAEVYG